jgi:hypothetical protein
MPTNFTPRSNYSLARKFRDTDEQLASVFNQTWQAIADQLQLLGNTSAQIEQQINVINNAVVSIETSFSTQQTNLQAVQNTANPILVTSFQTNTTANTLNTSNSSAVAKIATANALLTTADTNLTAVSADALPYNAFLSAVASSTKNSGSMLTINSTGSINWRVSSGQSFTYEMASVSCRRNVTLPGGNLTPNNFNTAQMNTEGYINCRNIIGLEEVDLNFSSYGLKVPCTGGNCRYYVFSFGTFCGISGGNTRIMLGSDQVAIGSAVQSIAGRSAAGEDFNQGSTGFGVFVVTTAAPELRLEAIASATHPNNADASLGRPVGNSSGGELYASLVVLRRRFL